MKVSSEDGAMLVKQARKSVVDFLTKSETVSQNKEFLEKFAHPSGVFVTLNKNNSLRGCIGYPFPDKVLSSALKEAAISAATSDPRFPTVSIEELDEITFEVTILSEPKIIQVEKAQQYLDQIRVSRDGLVVRNGFNSGLLLPQVPVKYNWSAVEFLEHTCKKSGLQKDCWKDADTEILKFQGVIFAETSPNGQIRQEL